MRIKAFHRNLADWAQQALLLEASLCRACWVSRLPLSAVLQPAHGLERCLGAEHALEAPAARCTDQISAPPVKPRTSQPDPLNDAASLGGALLRVANALEQKHGSLGEQYTMLSG